MKVKELKELLARHDRFDDTDVQVVLSIPSIGGCATAIVKDAHFGFDWDRGLLLRTEERLAPKENKQDIFESAYELLMFIATEALSKKRHTYEHRRATRILLKYGVTPEQIKKYHGLFHRDKEIIREVVVDEC